MESTANLHPEEFGAAVDLLTGEDLKGVLKDVAEEYRKSLAEESETYWHLKKCEREREEWAEKYQIVSQRFLADTVKDSLPMVKNFHLRNPNLND